jgi:hypothetical protein
LPLILTAPPIPGGLHGITAIADDDAQAIPSHLEELGDDINIAVPGSEQVPQPPAQGGTIARALATAWAATSFAERAGAAEAVAADRETGSSAGTAADGGAVGGGRARETEPLVWSTTANLRINPQQQRAVEAIVDREHGQWPFVIFGPPGTGKTLTGQLDWHPLCRGRLWWLSQQQKQAVTALGATAFVCCYSFSHSCTLQR